MKPDPAFGETTMKHHDCMLGRSRSLRRSPRTERRRGGDSIPRIGSGVRARRLERRRESDHPARGGGHGRSRGAEGHDAELHRRAGPPGC